MSKIQEYLDSKGINASFNTLGRTPLLNKLWVQEVSDILINSNQKQSNYVKLQCYQKYYNLQPRKKCTGFEKFDVLDYRFRLVVDNMVPGLRGHVTQHDFSTDPATGSYLDELKSSFRKFVKPLLYLSGGLDSEFVAHAMLEAGVEFTPVIFHMCNSAGNVLNVYDITYAIDFCVTHGITPIIRKLNIELLWTNPDFIALAKDTGMTSPQLNTYVYMVEQMAQEYPESTHVFGGEVRFWRNTSLETHSDLSGFAVLAKEPAGNLAYNGGSYTNTRTSSTWPSALTISLVYNYTGVATNNQTWSITGSSTLTGGTTSGNWYIGETGGGTGFEWSTNGGGTWNNMTVGSNTIATLSLSPGATVTNSTTVNLSVRNKSSPQITISSSVTLTNTYVYVPSLLQYNTNSTYTVPNGVTSIQVLMAGGGGGGTGASDSAAMEAGAGGGGGEVVYLSSYAVSPGQTINITVGTGGGGSSAGSGGGNGSSSLISGGTGGTISAQGGFGTTADIMNPTRYVDGGDAGNGIYTGSLGDPVSSSMRGGGGGGDSANGGGIGVWPSTPKGGDGGNGTQYTIGGTPITLGGGGGGSTISGTQGVGGTGGGATAIFMPTTGGTAPGGTANTGGGGAGATATNFGGQFNTGGPGGTGVVYIYG